MRGALFPSSYAQPYVSSVLSPIVREQSKNAFLNTKLGSRAALEQRVKETSRMEISASAINHSVCSVSLFTNQSVSQSPVLCSRCSRLSWGRPTLLWSAEELSTGIYSIEVEVKVRNNFEGRRQGPWRRCVCTVTSNSFLYSQPSARSKSWLEKGQANIHWLILFL